VYSLKSTRDQVPAPATKVSTTGHSLDSPAESLIDASPLEAEGSPFEDHIEEVGSRGLGGGGWQAASQLAPYLMTTLVSIVAARVLGPDGMGRQSYISFIVLATMTLCSAGFPNTLPRYVAELIGSGQEGKIRSLVAWSWRIALVAGLIGSGVLLYVAFHGATPELAWLFAAVAVLPGVLHKVPGATLLGAQRWKQSAIVVLVAGAAGTIATVIALLLGGGITGIFAVLAASNTLMLVAATFLSRRLIFRVKAAREPLGPLTNEFMRFALLASVPVLLGFIVFSRSEFFFLAHYSTDKQIALYSIAFSAYLALLTLPVSLNQMFAPAVATLVGAGAHDRISSGYARGIRLLLLIVIPITAGALVFMPPLIRLVYGAQYGGAGTIVLVLLIPLPLLPAGGLSSGLLFGYGRLRVPLVAAAIAAVVDLGLAALLVPHLDAIGAAIANASAQSVSTLIVVGLCIRTVGGIQLAPRHLAKTIVASALAAGSAQAILVAFDQGVGSFLLALVVGMIVFAALATVARILPREDAEWLEGAMGANRSRIRLICRRLSGQPLSA
jgi:O-antigen/teichoic acid export membrane protein